MCVVFEGFYLKLESEIVELCVVIMILCYNEVIIIVKVIEDFCCVLLDVVIYVFDNNLIDVIV